MAFVKLKKKEKVIMKDVDEWNLLDREDGLFLQFPSLSPTVSYRIDKENDELYISNREGRTIDSFRWKQK